MLLFLFPRPALPRCPFWSLRPATAPASVSSNSSPRRSEMRTRGAPMPIKRRCRKQSSHCSFSKHIIANALVDPDWYFEVCCASGFRKRNGRSADAFLIPGPSGL